MTSDIRKDLRAAIGLALMDETNGVPAGCIVEAGCEVRRYADPIAAASAFIDGVVDGVLETLKGYGDDLLNDLIVDEDEDAWRGTTIVVPKPLGVQGHLRMIRQRTVEAYDAGRLDADQLKHITPDMIARWRSELEKPT